MKHHQLTARLDRLEPAKGPPRVLLFTYDESDDEATRSSKRLAVATAHGAKPKDFDLILAVCFASWPRSRAAETLGASHDAKSH